MSAPFAARAPRPPAGRGARSHIDAVDAHRTGDVFDALLAQIGESGVEPVAHLVAHDPADADAPRLRQGFQAGGDIDAVTVNIVAVDDDIAEIDPHAQFDTTCLGNLGIAFGHAVLHFDRASDRVDDARKLDQYPVAGGLDDAASMLGDFGMKQYGAMLLEVTQRTFLIDAHQPAVPSHIAGEDRRKPALDPFVRHKPSAIVPRYISSPSLNRKG